MFRYGVVFFLLSACLYLVQELARPEPVPGGVASKGPFADAVCYVVRLGKIVVLAWWWLYVYWSISASGRHGWFTWVIAALVVAVLTFVAVLLFGLVGAALRFLA